jgi:Ser/Thr protein kinase RdoA (MazF antagonist)
VSQRPATFTSDLSIELLRAACRQVGLDPTGARVLRHHTNAVYRLNRHATVVKITRPGVERQEVTQTVALARRLAAAGVPAVRLWPYRDQPVTLDGSHATFWIAVDTAREPVAADLAMPLRRLHQLTTPADIDIPSLDPFTAITRSLSRPTVLDAGDLAFLRTYADQLRDDHQDLIYEQPLTFIHGDAHHSNTLISPDGPILADWESASLGPSEWDLVTLAVHCQRFGHPPREYQDFVAAYGRDIRTWPGYETLRAVRELRMITTNAWKTTPATPAAEEVHRRIKALRCGDSDAPWQLL